LAFGLADDLPHLGEVKTQGADGLERNSWWTSLGMTSSFISFIWMIFPAIKKGIVQLATFD
jgi:hypothetical protein